MKAVLKRYVAKLEKLEADYEKLIAKRDETYEGRSDKWKASEKGVKYLDATVELSSVLYDISWARKDTQEVLDDETN